MEKIEELLKELNNNIKQLNKTNSKLLSKLDNMHAMFEIIYMDDLDIFDDWYEMNKKLQKEQRMPFALYKEISKTILKQDAERHLADAKIIDSAEELDLNDSNKDEKKYKS